MEREAFLARVRSATGALPVQDAVAPPPISLDDDLLAIWRERAAALGVVVHDVPGPNEARDLVRRLAEERVIGHFCAWDDEHLPVHGIAAYLQTAGLREVRVEGAPPATLDPVGLGVTGADVLLAETGSLVVSSGAGRPRMASLIGTLHVAVATPDQVSPSLRAWLPEAPTDAANTVVVTGPSRTADIEGVLVRGVHGPAEVHVVLVG